MSDDSHVCCCVLGDDGDGSPWSGCFTILHLWSYIYYHSERDLVPWSSLRTF